MCTQALFIFFAVQTGIGIDDLDGQPGCSFHNARVSLRRRATQQCVLQISSISSSLMLWMRNCQKPLGSMCFALCSCNNQCWASRSGPWIFCAPYCQFHWVSANSIYSDVNLTGTGWTSCSSFGNLWLHERSEGGHDAKVKWLSSTSTGSTKEKSVPYFLLFVPEFYLNIFIIHFSLPWSYLTSLVVILSLYSTSSRICNMHLITVFLQVILCLFSIKGILLLFPHLLFTFIVK